MISLRVCLPSKFNLTHLLVGIFLETTVALCKHMSITTDLMDFPQKSDRSFFEVVRGKGVTDYDLLDLSSTKPHNRFVYQCIDNVKLYRYAKFDKKNTV